MTAEGAPAETPDVAAKPRHRGVLLGSLMVLVATMGRTVSIPHLQSRRDALGCDALCRGGQTSLRSALGLVGAAVIGRASDRFGRHALLLVSVAGGLAGTAISAGLDNLDGMWYAIVPEGLLCHGYGVAKALFSDYADEQDNSEVERVGAIGKLGMAMGMSLLLGPGLAAPIPEYRQVLALSALLTLASGVVVFFLPRPMRTVKSKADGRGMMAFLSLPVLKTRGAQLLICVRLVMALAFHMFSPVFSVSLKRFEFGPSDHAMFMGSVGLSYALSQGIVAKFLIKAFGDDSTWLLSLCFLVLGGSRWLVLQTDSLVFLYAITIFMVIALGVVNVAITTASSGLSEGDQLGGFMGVLEAVEQVGGIFGPTIGGMLASSSFEHATVLTVMSAYFLAFLLVALFFRKHVVEVVALRVANGKKVA